ncbi:MAG: transglycosylase domain-containing protein [Bacteroidales bacterium]|nr:transglycosylase domain-containing protein [Bacteroidales bacterium]
MVATNRYKKKSKFSRSWKGPAVKALLNLLGAGFLLFAFLIFLIWAGFFGPLPSRESLVHIRQNTASEVYSLDGKLMGRYFIENRLTIGNKNISPHVIHALVATEDSRFFDHHGIDYISLGRVLVRTILLGERSQGGGSTISEQLARNIFPRKGHFWGSLLVSKVKEAFIAARLEKVYDKEQILTLYLNTVPFGEDIYGIEIASQRFFGKPAGALNPAEAATLVGMLAANTAYSPRLHPERSKKRRNIVLRRMKEHGFLTEEEMRNWQKSPLVLHYRRIDQNAGIAPYFRDIARLEAEKILKEKYGDTVNILTDGLKIYTTIHSVLQQSAEQAVQKRMKVLQKEFDRHWQGRMPWPDSSGLFMHAVRNSSRYKYWHEKGLTEKAILQKMSVPVTLTNDKTRQMTIYTPLDSVKQSLMTLHAGFMAEDPYSGFILAWVGGIDHSRFQYDHVTAKRQAGSTFKPFVYAAALEKGISPCRFFSNDRRIFTEFDDWSPENAEGEYNGFYSLKGALAHSVNTVTAAVLEEVGVARVVEMAEKLGIRSEIPAVPSIALGTVSLSLLELTNAYTPFVNGGKRKEPVSILKITDSHGGVLYEYHAEDPQTRVLDEDISRMMLYMLREVVDSGTARSLRSVYHLQEDLAGKTGTTQNNADGWFIGITPGLVAGCWVGAESPQVHFRTITLGQGAHMALPVFAGFVKNINRDPQARKYVRGSFPLLTAEDMKKLDCPDYSPVNPEENFFKRLFGRKQLSDSLRQVKQKMRQERQKIRRKKIRETMQRLFGKKKR